jgi:hypothetical protein
LYALCADPVAAKILRACGADVGRIVAALEAFLRERLPALGYEAPSDLHGKTGELGFVVEKVPAFEVCPRCATPLSQELAVGLRELLEPQGRA